MAAIHPNLIRVAVTNGDAIPTNRTKGKSNTGTYFVSSTEDWPHFKDFFDEKLTFRFDSLETVGYCAALLAVCGDFKELFPDQFKNVESFVQFFKEIKNPTTRLKVRINDKRVFMSFENNADEAVNAFRHLLYGELSVIVMELRGNECFIYPDLQSSETIRTVLNDNFEECEIIC